MTRAARALARLRQLRNIADYGMADNLSPAVVAEARNLAAFMEREMGW